MSRQLKVSIITVALNSVKTIKDTLECIKSQDYNNIEYIVIDGGSTDGTIDVIRSYHNQITYFVSEDDKGIYDAMNKGIVAATGDIVGILNSDDFYSSNTIISDIVEVFQNRKCDSVYGDLVYVKPDNTKKVIRYWSAGHFTIRKLKRGWMLPHPTFFVRKAMYNRFGLYNIDLKSASDYEMILRLLYKHNITVYYINKVLVRMRIGGQSNASLINRIKANREDIKAWRFHNLTPPFFFRFRKPMIKLKQFFNKPKNE